MESKANVADAVSRGDLRRARDEGWTRLQDHANSITSILVLAAADAEYAAGKAADDLPAQVWGQSVYARSDMSESRVTP